MARNSCHWAVFPTEFALILISVMTICGHNNPVFLGAKSKFRFSFFRIFSLSFLKNVTQRIVGGLSGCRFLRSTLLSRESDPIGRLFLTEKPTFLQFSETFKTYSLKSTVKNDLKRKIWFWNLIHNASNWNWNSVMNRIFNLTAGSEN